MITFDRDLCILDTETLGLELSAPIWEFAAIRLHRGGLATTIELQIIHQQGGWLETLPNQFADDYRARYDIQRALPPAQAAREIHALTDGAIVAGSNPSFDMERLGLLMDRFGIAPGWHYHPLDIPSMAAGFMAHRKSFVIESKLDWKSSEMSKRVGVDPDEFARHTAMGDVQWCLAQWQAMNGLVVGE